MAKLYTDSISYILKRKHGKFPASRVLVEVDASALVFAVHTIFTMHRQIVYSQYVK